MFSDVALILNPPNYVFKPLDRMHLAEPKEKEVNAPLTIFYGGNVNVFNDISAQQVTNDTFSVVMNSTYECMRGFLFD